MTEIYETFPFYWDIPSAYRWSHKTEEDPLTQSLFTVYRLYVTRSDGAPVFLLWHIFKPREYRATDDVIDVLLQFVTRIVPEGTNFGLTAMDEPGWTEFSEDPEWTDDE